MRTTTLGEIFTDAQLEEAASIMVSSANPHKELVALLSQDKSRLTNLGIDVGYAAYILEWKRDDIVTAYRK